jgi:hypothetical protein
MKVKSRLESNPVAFKEMCSIMGQFQSSSNSFLELYRKIEYILKDNMDLLEEFILFLSPEAAALCGVQFQHFLYVRMREFFSKLKVNVFLGSNFMNPTMFFVFFNYRFISKIALHNSSEL